MTTIRPNEILPLSLSTQNTSGAATDTDAVPTASLFRNGTQVTPLTVTVTNPVVGVRFINITVASSDGWVAGDRGQGYITYAIGGVTQKLPFSFFVRDSVASEAATGILITPGNKLGTDANGRIDVGRWLGTVPLALVNQFVQALVSDYATNKAPLQPTVAGRTLDVSTTGEAGLDFDNIKQATSPTTLNNITVPTTGTVTGNVQGNVSGAVTIAGASITAIAAAIETELINDNTGGAFMQAIADKLQAEFDFDDLTIAAISTAVRDGILNRVLAGNHDINGTPGKLLQTAATATNVTSARDAILAEIADLNNLSANDVQNAAGLALTAYAPLTGTQATDNTNAILDAIELVDIEAHTVSDLVVDGAFTAEALANAPTGSGGSGDGYTNTDRTRDATTAQRIANLNTTIEQDGAAYRFTSNALEQAPAGGGGGGGGDFTNEEKEQLLTDTNYTANRLRATGSGDVNEPLILTPVPGIPADMVAVFWNPTQFRIPTTARASVGYVNDSIPLVDGPPSVDLTAKKVYPVAPKDDAGKPIPNAMLYWLLPKSSTVSGWAFYLDCDEANHDIGKLASRFVVPDGTPPTQEGGVVGYLMSQLLDRSFNPLP